MSFDSILHSLFAYYGLDWLAFIFGLAGMHLLTHRNKWGFVLSGLACVCGLAVALCAQQFGFVIYNMALLVMMIQGFVSWDRPAIPARKTSRPVRISKV